MIRMFLRTIGWGVFVVLLVGCSVFPLRKESASAPSHIMHSRSAAYHYSLGILHALNENPDEAIREMEEALRIDPDSAYLAGELASLYMERGDAEKALAICLRTLEKHPNDGDIRLLLGGFYLNGKDYANAAAEYRRVVDLQPKNAMALFYLGTSLAELKRFDEAIAAFRELLAIDPEHFMGGCCPI